LPPPWDDRAALEDDVRPGLRLRRHLSGGQAEASDAGRAGQRHEGASRWSFRQRRRNGGRLPASVKAAIGEKLSDTNVAHEVLSGCFELPSDALADARFQSGQIHVSNQSVR
jgi:hypothetical protein